MIELAGELICATEAEAEVVRTHLDEHVRLTRAEPGCRLFEVLPVGGGIWTVQEWYVDMAAFEAHQARATASDWGRATLGIRRNYDLREVAEPAPAPMAVHDHPHDHPHDPPGIPEDDRGDAG